MVIQGLSPAKKQCYFIVRGNQLCMDRSYFGTVTVCKRLSNVHDAFARAVFEDDEFEYHVDITTLDIVIDKHVSSLQTIDPDKVKAAYSVVVRSDGTLYIEIMNSEQIKRAWNQGAMKGQSGAHKNFAEEMSKKTVLNRGCKLFVNSSSDSNLLIDSINRTTELEYLPEPPEEIPEPKSLSESQKEPDGKGENVKEESNSDPRYSDAQFYIDTFEGCTTIKQADDFAKDQAENIQSFDKETANKINQTYMKVSKQLRGK
jgi:recombination protein RecT